VLLVDEEAQVLLPRAAVGVEETVEEGPPVPLGKGFAGRVAAERTPIVVDDIAHSEVINPVLGRKGIKTLLGVPLLVGGSPIGVLHVGSLVNRVFDPADVELLQLAADRAALAIRHANLFEDERRARLRLEHVQEVTDISLGRLDVDELLAELLARLFEILQLSSATLWLQGDEDRDPVVRASAGSPSPGDSEHVVPLTVRSESIGGLRVTAAHELDADEIHLVHLVAERAALALEKSRVDDDSQRLDRLKLNFVAIASHELRTPAAAVYGALATLRGRGDTLSPAVREELSEAAFEQSDRLRRLIEQLLDLSRLDARSVNIEAQELVVREVLEDVVRASNLLASDVVIDVDADLTVVADPLVIDRVVTNLLVNARSYGRPPIRLAVARNGSSITIAVEDSGEGISEELAPRLFGRFERGREGHGSGLGLAIAKAYATAHGGDLVYKAGDQGARFELTLPIRTNA